MLKCEEIIGRKHFKSYSEFYLALCIADELGRRGSMLDMSNMRVDKDILSNFEVEYFKYLTSIGVIMLDDNVDVLNNYKDTSTIKYYMNMEDITKMKDRLVSIVDNEYYWSPDIISNDTLDKPYSFRNVSNTGNLLMHITAYLIVGMYLGDLDKKKFKVSFNSIKAKNTSYYVNLYSCSQTISWFKDFIILDVDFGEINVDIQYSIFCNNSQVAGHHVFLPISEKFKLMKKYGMVEGSIVVLWTRGGMCASNIMGKITNATIARIDEIGDDFLGVTTLALNKTKEEQEMDYYSIDEDKRYLFSDMLHYKPSEIIKTLSMYELGVNDYFYDEYMFISNLDKSEVVYKYITINGEVAEVQMSGIDAIYWILCQYCIEFDRELYRSMYNDGKLLMWDEFGNDDYE